MTPPEQLRAALRSGRLAHCYLLCGPRGPSEEVALRAGAAYLCLSDERVDAAEPCGECVSCLALRSGTHPDLRRWEPERGAWRIEQVRSLMAEAFHRPAIGRRRVHILGDAHLLTLPSANALLKLLEEPPAGTVFFLLADSVSPLPGTLLSRSQLLTWSEAEPAQSPEGEGPAGQEVLGAAARGKGSHLFLLARRLADGGGEDTCRQLGQALRDLVVGWIREGRMGEARVALQAWEAVERAAGRLEAHANARLVWECLLLELADLVRACPSLARGL